MTGGTSRRKAAGSPMSAGNASSGTRGARVSRARRARLSLTEPVGLSAVPVVLLVAWCVQMTQWHWADRWQDWRGWTGFAGGWAAAYLLEAVTVDVRGWLAARAARKAAAS